MRSFCLTAYVTRGWAAVDAAEEQENPKPHVRELLEIAAREAPQLQVHAMLAYFFFNADYPTA